MKQIHLQFRNKVPALLNRLYVTAMTDSGPVGVMAAREFLDRVVGKAVPQAVTDKAQQPIETSWQAMPEERLKAIIDADGALPEEPHATQSADE